MSGLQLNFDSEAVVKNSLIFNLRTVQDEHHA